jgi:hypothetical protein
VLLVMIFLLGDVFRDGCDVRFTHAEYAVSSLPGEIPAPFFVQPTRSVRLHHAGDLRRKFSGTNP